MHGTSPRLLKRKGDTTQLPQVAGQSGGDGRWVATNSDMPALES